MKRNIALTVASLLSLLFMTFHMTHDVIRQAEGAVTYPIPVLVFALWMYGTLMLSDRVWGYVIMLLGGLFGAGMIIVHSKGIEVGKSGRLLLRLDAVCAQHDGMGHDDPVGSRPLDDASLSSRSPTRLHIRDARHPAGTGEQQRIS